MEHGRRGVRLERAHRQLHLGSDRHLRHDHAPAQLIGLLFLVACSGGGGQPDASADAQVSDGGSFDATFERQPFPQVPNVGGRVLHSPTLVTIVASNDDMPAQLQAFSDAVPASDFWTSMAAEYGLGSITSSAHLTGPSMAPGAYSTAQLAAYVSGVIGSVDAGLAPNGDTIYLVYLPSGATYSGTFAQDCGYHTSYPQGTSTGDQLATVIRCTPWADKETALGEMTRTAAHEIAESATDPLGKGYNLGATGAMPWTASIWQGWVAAGLIELGDLCEGTRIFDMAGNEYQRTWSNAGAAAGGDPCIPPSPQAYDSVSTPQDWYSGAAGSTVSIHVEGWSTSPTSDWLLEAHVELVKGAFTQVTNASLGIATDLGLGSSSTCAPRQAMNAGHTGTVSLTVPASAASGDYIAIGIYSFRESPTCYPALTDDDYHFWPVGVYVP